MILEKELDRAEELAGAISMLEKLARFSRDSEVFHLALGFNRNADKCAKRAKYQRRGAERLRKTLITHLGKMQEKLKQ
jgi:hypothetical protein